ncbi:hypothetical protein DVH24_011314 [Malus domestica]|uniref:Uncharacterized protein n=1 Tax=Malus domestica TaxID=3750 RepID=A0A498JSW5_MALDO|nr:hypothetical protein DVH24_011314 [Malus domestica]
MTLKHVGKRDRSEVVFVYSKPPDGIVGTHAKQVIGFERVFAKSGQKTEICHCSNTSYIFNLNNILYIFILHVVWVRSATLDTWLPDRDGQNTYGFG